MPYTNEYVVALVEVRIEVRYAHRTNGKYANPMTSIPQAEKGQGTAKEFKG